MSSGPSKPFTQFRNMPGVSSETFTDVAQQLQGNFNHGQTFQLRLSKDVRDTGNASDTKVIRDGFILAYKDDDDTVAVAWDPTGTITNSGKRLAGFMLEELYMDGSVDKSVGLIVVSGIVDPGQILIPGAASRGIVGNTKEWLLRTLAAKQICFEDRPFDQFHHPVKVLSKTAAYTLNSGGTNEDVLAEINNTGAAGSVTVTLPTTIIAGMKFYFRSTVAQDLVVAGATGTISGAGNLAADTATIALANVGSRFAIVGSDDATKWEIREQVGTVTLA